jgi:CRP-like cAMP-binding protein
MGGGASKADTQLIQDQERQIAQKDAEIKRLSKEVAALKKQGSTVVSLSSHTAPTQQKYRRLEVSAETRPLSLNDEEEIANNYRKKVVAKDNATRSLINGIVVENILFRELSKEEREECVDAFERVTCAAGEFIIKQGDAGNHFYLVQSGAFEILVAQELGGPSVNFGQIAAGRSFGELALMYNTPRAASIKAVSNSVLWVLDRNVYKAITIHHKVEKSRRFVEILRSVPTLQCLSREELFKMAGALEAERFEPGEVIIRQGEVCQLFLVRYFPVLPFRIAWGPLLYHGAWGCSSVRNEKRC